MPHTPTHAATVIGKQLEEDTQNNLPGQISDGASASAASLSFEDERTFPRTPPSVHLVLSPKSANTSAPQRPELFETDSLPAQAPVQETMGNTPQQAWVMPSLNPLPNATEKLAGLPTKYKACATLCPTTAAAAMVSYELSFNEHPYLGKAAGCITGMAPTAVGGAVFGPAYGVNIVGPLCLFNTGPAITTAVFYSIEGECDREQKNRPPIQQQPAPRPSFHHAADGHVDFRSEVDTQSGERRSIASSTEVTLSPRTVMSFGSSVASDKAEHHASPRHSEGVSSPSADRWVHRLSNRSGSTVVQALSPPPRPYVNTRTAQPSPTHWAEREQAQTEALQEVRTR